MGAIPTVSSRITYRQQLAKLPSAKRKAAILLLLYLIAIVIAVTVARVVPAYAELAISDWLVSLPAGLLTVVGIALSLTENKHAWFFVAVVLTLASVLGTLYQLGVSKRDARIAADAAMERENQNKAAVRKLSEQVDSTGAKVIDAVNLALHKRGSGISIQRTSSGDFNVIEKSISTLNTRVDELRDAQALRSLTPKQVTGIGKLAKELPNDVKLWMLTLNNAEPKYYANQIEQALKPSARLEKSEISIIWNGEEPSGLAVVIKSNQDVEVEKAAANLVLGMRGLGIPVLTSLQPSIPDPKVVRIIVGNKPRL